MQNNIPEIAIIGGPCSGKTTALKYLQKRFTKDGYRVFVGREIPTDVILGGVHDIAELAKKDMKKYIGTQRSMLLENIDQRKHLLERANVFKDEKCIIFYDRYGMCQKGYMPEGSFERVLREEGLSYFDVRDCILGAAHLVTAALGAEKFYTRRNNKARHEATLEAAREADRKTLNAWLGHPHLRVIDNSTGFNKKMKRLYKAIRSFIEPVEIERKFLLRSPPDFSKRALRESVKIPIEQDYLLSKDGSTFRVRKRMRGDWAVYYRTKKNKIKGAGIAQEEIDEIISEAEYNQDIKNKDPRAKKIIKNRHHFLYKFQHFELDQILSPKKLWILEIEVLKEDEKIVLPPFLDIEKEVTGLSRYSNFGIAKGL